MAMSPREAAMRNLQVMCFYLDDITLFLQSHPNNPAALRSYEKYRQLKNEAEQEYMNSFGPLRSDNVYVTDHWTWADMPWPWERQG